MVWKDGNTTDLTVGRYTSLVSFTQNKVGTESVEVSTTWVTRGGEVFSAKGDSGVLVWHMRNGQSSHCWPAPLWTKQGWLNQQSCYVLHPWLVSPGPDQEEMLTFIAPPGQLENNINGFSLFLHAFVHIADECRMNVEASVIFCDLFTFTIHHACQVPLSNNTNLCCNPIDLIRM
jgi:hypothetical protein